MTIHKTTDGKAMRVALVGRLDTITTPELEAAIKDSLAEIESLHFDFAELDYISSSGLRVLLSAYKTLSVKNGTVTVCNANSTIQEILEITGFSSFITVS